MLYTFSYETLNYKISHLEHSIDFNSHDFWRIHSKKIQRIKHVAFLIIKVSVPQRYKIAAIKNMINRIKIIFASHA